jgi:hypothetical protein
LGAGDGMFGAAKPIGQLILARRAVMAGAVRLLAIVAAFVTFALMNGAAQAQTQQ